MRLGERPPARRSMRVESRPKRRWDPILLFVIGVTLFAALIRCTQYVHFSITPRLLTVTSGLRPSFKLGVFQSWYSRKLNRRTLYGQLFEQYRVPTQRLYTMSLSPSALWTVAPTGQTTSHGAFSHCMQGTG